jgi:hypothetical protein
MPTKTVLNGVELGVLLGSNVIPKTRKVSAESWAGTFELIDLYDPRDVHLNRVTGGFNTVVQVSASYCLRSYAEQIGSVTVIARSRSNRLEPRLAELKGQLADTWWDTLFLEANRTYGFGYDLTPVRIDFGAGSLATITLRGNISFMTEAIIVDPVHGTGPQFPVGPSPLEVLSQTEAPGTPPPMRSPLPQRTMSTGGQPESGSPARADLSASLSIGDIDAIEFERPMRAIHQIGAVEVVLTAPYASTERVPQRAVDVWLNMNAAKIVVKPAGGDAKLFYDLFLAAKERNLAGHLAPVAQVALVPTISLAGRNSANSRINEFTEFETRTFDVADHSRQALCVAFDVVPSCRGIIENVKHFIGGSDYGVIHDEYVVERILRHKWNEGGFDRSIGLAHNVSLKTRRDGRDTTEDAMVFGRLLLNTLDTVALIPHADLRTDVLSLGGQAQAVPDRVVLTDGTVLTPANADLGPAQDANWAVDVAASISVPLEPDPELRDFQTRAHLDGIRHLARPFSRFPRGLGLPEVQYTRTEAVLKRMFFLGQLPQVFF